MTTAARPVVLVTGATGFVGSGLLRRFAVDARHDVAVALRNRTQLATAVARCHAIGDFSASTDWSAALSSVEHVIHCAARVHVMAEGGPQGVAAYDAVNVQATLNLARQAAAAGVRRFVFLSSIKVNGEATQPGHPFTASDTPAPTDPYGVSKRDAEQQLLALCAGSAMSCSIVRPPLVYGPGVGANFASLIRMVRRGFPLPLASVDNRRSFVALDNLVDLLVLCLEHPAAANQVFLVSDGEDLSTPALIRRIAHALGRDARLFGFPPALLRRGAALLGKSAIASRLCDSLQVDIGKTRDMLGWRPPVSVDEGLSTTLRELRA